MAFSSGFFNSKGLDRTYTAENFCDYLGSIICNGIQDNYGDCFKLTAASSGLKVTVGRGKAWINGHYFINDRTLSTVYEDIRLNVRKMSKADLVDFIDKLFEQPTSVILDNKPSKSADHPTMKPITLCAKLIYNSSHEGDTVLEPFGGSGSTLVAAEQLNRKCCAIELEPKYCDVIVRRYKELCPAVQVKHIRDGVEIYD